MFCIYLTSDLKTSGPILCQTSATSKSFARCTLEKSPIYFYSESCSIQTGRMNVPTGPALNLVASRFSGGETAFFPMLNCRVTQRIGIRRGSTAKPLLRLKKILCPASVPCALSPSTCCRINGLLLNVCHFLPVLEKSKLFWETA